MRTTDPFAPLAWTLAVAALAVGPAAAQGVLPEYDESGRLRLPADVRAWPLVGTSLGLSYSEGEAGGEMFHHTLMEPTAHEHYRRTGEFRDGTMLALLLSGVDDGAAPSRRGRYAGDLHAVEMAVKDTRREGAAWAYYGFGADARAGATAGAFPDASCHDCHAEHGALDNVFVQFYSLLPDRPTTERASTAPARSPAVDAALALGGRDPIALIDGLEVDGKPEIVHTHAGHVYRFVSEPHRARFAADPERYAIQNSTCLVAPGARPRPELYTVHRGHLFTFATEQCVELFEGDPESYLLGFPAIEAALDRTSPRDDG